MKKLALISLLFAPWSWGAGRIEATLNAIYDLDSAGTYIYCVYNGVGDQPLSGDKKIDQLVTTSGSSTTVAALSASTTDPFANVAVGDLLIFRRTFSATTGGTFTTYNERVVTAKASADSITIDTAIELPLTGTNFGYKTRSCGTASTSGWVPVRSLKEVSFTWLLNQISVASGGVRETVECRNTTAGNAVNTVYNPTADTAVAAHTLLILEPWDECRVGYQLTGADDGGDTGANAEQISVQLRARTEQ